MNRRSFVKTSLASAGLGSLAYSMNADPVFGAAERPAREIYELRLYHLRRGPQQKVFDDFYREAALPALNRIGIGPVGVFQVAYGPDSPTVYVLMPHSSFETFVTVADRVRSDPEYQKAGAEFINAAPSEPSYVRVESMLMVAFESIPKLEVPAGAKEKKPRLFELRTYESHSEKANRKKIEMFNRGEIPIFRRTGLAPVFFGETIIGPKMPNLTYMLVFDNMAAREKNWGAFGGDPEWRKLSSTPGYTDPEIVSNISNVFLRPASYSQI